MYLSSTLLLGLLLMSLPSLSFSQSERVPLKPQVLNENQVYSFADFNNGSGPMWCRGNTCIVRVGEQLIVSGLEVLPSIQPLNNCLPLMFTSFGGGWETFFSGTRFTREPCPIVRFDDGRVFLSHNPTLTEIGVYSGPAQPMVLEFESMPFPQEPVEHLPQWEGKPEFTEHSYRTFVADGKRHELLYIQNIGYAHAEWSFMDGEGKWSTQGKIVWPFEEQYDQPQPVRLAYPVVALRDRQVFFAGVSDIVEPNKQWREYKYERTGQKWDYDFRRLFFTWSDDITQGEFHPWIELASRDQTAGWITPWDMYLHHDETVYLLWSERAIDERLRDAFFPEAKQRHALEMAVIQDGKVMNRITVLAKQEGEDRLVPDGARFHVTDDHRLFIVYYAGGTVAGKPASGNYVTEVFFDGRIGKPEKIPFSIPFQNFFTASVRAGNEPSPLLDLFGPHGNNMRYGAVHLFGR